MSVLISFLCSLVPATQSLTMPLFWHFVITLYLPVLIPMADMSTFKTEGRCLIRQDGIRIFKPDGDKSNNSPSNFLNIDSVIFNGFLSINLGSVRLSS